MGVQVRPLFPVLLESNIATPEKMDELKEKLAALGIEADQIEGVIETVLGFVKDKLPDGMEGMFDSVLKGEVPEIGGDLLDKAKGLFGG